MWASESPYGSLMKTTSQGICSFAFEFGQCLVWHIDNKNVFVIFLFSNIFFLQERFFYGHSTIFFTPISKMFCNFSLKLDMANRRHFFLALSLQEIEEQINSAKKKKLRVDL